jgi:two-component system sensor histidine kinase CiaH
MPHVRRKLILIITMYWVLLLYILVALVWWFISLEQQNMEMAQLRLLQKSPGEPGYTELVAKTQDIERRKHAQYVGEGVIFMLLIVIGAVFVYRAMRRQWKLSQQQQNFMMAVTHELKTPIAVAKLNLETILKRKLEPAVQEKMIQDTILETDRLNDLCNNILLASRLESGRYTYHKEPINLNEIAEKSVAQYSARFPNRMIRLEQHGQAELFGEPILIKLLISNLLDNAIKYTPVEAPIVVKLEELKNGSLLSVSDNGPGIPENEKREVFQKFYRLGDEHTRMAKGTGLGLYLCKKIARDHNATISIKDNIPKGSIFTVHFQTT